MANLFSIYYDLDTPTTAAVEVADADNLWVTHSLQVRVSLRGPGSFTPTQVKVWGIDGDESEGEASWQPMSATITGTLQDISEVQYIHAKFWDGGSNYADATASGIYFTYTPPSLSTAVTWKDTPIDERTTVGVLTNLAQDTELTMDKGKNPGLLFHNLDISDLAVASSEYATTITCTSGSAVYTLLRDDFDSYIPVKKVFSSTTKTPFIKYRPTSGSFVTITDYDGNVKSGYTHKIENVSWNDVNGEFTFDIHEFSTYGFAVIKSVVFTLDSQSGGYINSSISIKAKVTDTNNEGVEGAPVTFTIASGTNIGDFTNATVDTDAAGIATATLELDTLGTAYISAEVDGVVTAVRSKVYCFEQPTNTQRSLLTQYEQINTTLNFDDDITNVNSSSVAEPTNDTASGIEPDTLQHDLNVLRTLLKQLKGTSSWYEDPGTYDDFTSTPKQLTMSGIKGHTLDAKTIILSIEDDKSGDGYDVSTGVSGILITPTDARYADTVDRRGLPIFASSSGSFYDIGRSNEICVVDLVNRDTGTTFRDAGGKLIYGKLHNGADHGGSGENTDVYVKFYTEDGPYTFTASDPTNLMVVYPFRRLLSEMEEYDWMRTDFIGSWEGDAELMDDISKLWSYTGATNHATVPAWDNTGAGYAVISGSSLTTAINLLNDVIGDTSYSGTHYITAFEDITESLVALDNQTKFLADNLAAGTGIKYTETITSDISAGTTHDLPSGLTYIPYTAVSGVYGRNMDVFVNGQLLVASAGAFGANEDMDYSEVSSSAVKFHVDVNAYSNIMYVIRQ